MSGCGFLGEEARGAPGPPLPRAPKGWGHNTRPPSPSRGEHKAKPASEAPSRIEETAPTKQTSNQSPHQLEKINQGPAGGRRLRVRRSRSSLASWVRLLPKSRAGTAAKNPSSPPAPAKGNGEGAAPTDPVPLSPCPGAPRASSARSPWKQSADLPRRDKEKGISPLL